MKRQILAAIILVMVLVVSTEITAVEPETELGFVGTPSPKYEVPVPEALQSDDERVVIKYLSEETVPPTVIEGRGMTGGPPVTIYLPSIKRAVELFKSGSQELRLAIAKSLMWAPDEDFLSLWKMCGDEDYETRHYLFPKVIFEAQGETRDALRKWFALEADPSFAGALLRGLSSDSLFEGSDEDTEKLVFKFLEKLYEEKGKLFRHRILEGLDIKIAEVSIQEKVVKILPETESARDTLLSFMTSPGLKADEKILRTMWGKWGALSRIQSSKNHEFYLEASQSTVLAELWCLSHYKRGFSHDAKIDRAFKENVYRQLKNPDEAIRKALIEYLLDIYIEPWSTQFIEGLGLSASIREGILKDIEEIREALLKTKRYQTSKFKTPNLERRYQQLKKALE